MDSTAFFIKEHTLKGKKAFAEGEYVFSGYRTTTEPVFYQRVRRVTAAQLLRKLEIVH